MKLVWYIMKVPCQVQIPSKRRRTLLLTAGQNRQIQNHSRIVVVTLSRRSALCSLPTQILSSSPFSFTFLPFSLFFALGPVVSLFSFSGSQPVSPVHFFTNCIGAGPPSSNFPLLPSLIHLHSFLLSDETIPATYLCLVSAS